jgi:hypothetical protein
MDIHASDLTKTLRKYWILLLLFLTDSCGIVAEDTSILGTVVMQMAYIIIPSIPKLEMGSTELS